jgi:hypothetical protein
MSIVCVPQRTFWNLVSEEQPARQRSMSEFVVELVAQEQRHTRTDSVCEEQASEQSTCPAEDETASGSERSRWGDSEDEESVTSVVFLPLAELREDQDSFNQHTTRTRMSHSGTERVAKPIATLPDGIRTTIVLRSLPSTWWREDLVNALSSQGFLGRFDFAYLPINFKKSQAFGFAVVNFLTAMDAQQALAAFNGMMLDRRPVRADWSDAIQGPEALVAKYRNSAVMHDDVSECHRPLLFCQGQVVPFPTPTELVQAPNEHVQLPAQERKATPELAPRTTLIVRKLGRKSSIEQFMTLLNHAGFAAQFDFVYVPRHFGEGSSIGFAVVNFVDHSLASEALGKIAAGALSFNGMTLTAEWSETMDGLSALIEKYRGNKVMRKGMPKSFQPVLLLNGVPIPFPFIK